jgi:hypothetical protein
VGRTKATPSNIPLPGDDPTEDGGAAISVMQIDRGTVTYLVKGDTPLIFNQINTKARRELLLPAGKKNAAEKQASIKHDPVPEYRESVYRFDDDKHPTRLYLPSAAFKGSMCTAALDLPGTKKSQIGRLVWVEGDKTEIYGLPSLFMRIVRQADINRTPDVRTRAILPRWCAKVTVSFVKPILGAVQISNLLAAGGVFVGVGDYRQEKGRMDYGRFSLVGQNDEELRDIMANEGRAAQDEALERADPYDVETRELLDWYVEERLRRGNIVNDPTPKRGRKLQVAA